MKRKFLEAGCIAQQVFDIPNGVSFDQMNSISRDAARLKIRSKYRLPSGSQIILTVGRNHPVKRYDLIPEIIVSLARTRRDFVWIVVGAGCESLSDTVPDCLTDRHLRILESIGAQKRAGNGELSFPSSEILEIVKASDVVVSLSVIESFSLVTLEALAAGVPVVSTDAPGVRDLVENCRNGFLSPEGDVEAMVRNINALLSDAQMRKEMGARGQQKAKGYDWRVVAQKYVDLYSQSSF
jgi:glycosyltransferase involved in cell wall biosynthesis